MCGGCVTGGWQVCEMCEAGQGVPGGGNNSYKGRWVVCGHWKWEAAGWISTTHWQGRGKGCGRMRSYGTSISGEQQLPTPSPVGTHPPSPASGSTYLSPTYPATYPPYPTPHPATPLPPPASGSTTESSPSTSQRRWSNSGPGSTRVTVCSARGVGDPGDHTLQQQQTQGRGWGEKSTEH